MESGLSVLLQIRLAGQPTVPFHAGALVLGQRQECYAGVLRGTPHTLRSLRQPINKSVCCIALLC